jgi:release factor glutamine methyltransferase
LTVPKEQIRSYGQTPVPNSIFPVSSRLRGEIDPVQLRPALNSAIKRLTASHVPSPRLNAETLLMFTLGCDRAFLYAHPERTLSEEDQQRYDTALGQRATGIPAQYITGHQEFWGLDFIVSPAVLIPRPETEHLIEAVLDLTRGMHAPEIVDVGTGSGCIALALAHELPTARIHATDLSDAALEIATANAARLQLDTRVMFQKADLLSEFASNSFDFVVSNPPYVGESEEDQVQLEVRKFEPRSAVFAGPTGLEVIERLLPQAHTTLKHGGRLVMEISGTILSGVNELLRGWQSYEFQSDLQGIPRVAVAVK